MAYSQPKFIVDTNLGYSRQLKKNQYCARRLIGSLLSLALLFYFLWVGFTSLNLTKQVDEYIILFNLLGFQGQI